MHKGVILLVKASDKNEARMEAESFLENYGEGKVWDWYVIGGRWSALLNPCYNKFFKLQDKYKKEQPDVSEKKINKLAWKEVGGKGLNPYERNSWFGSYDDDIMPLKNCIKQVKSYMHKEPKEIVIKDLWDKMIKERKKEIRIAKKREVPLFCRMSAYYAQLYHDAAYDVFSFESNLYNANEYTSELPKRYDDWYAVVVDMHN